MPDGSEFHTVGAATLKPREVTVLRGLEHHVAVYTPAFTGTHCVDPLRDGQAELARVFHVDDASIRTHRKCPTPFLLSLPVANLWCGLLSESIMASISALSNANRF